MNADPRDTPEARAHKRECEVIREKLARYCFDEYGVPDIHERDHRSALRVVPTFDQTGRVHMTIEQLSCLIGLPRDQLAEGAIPLTTQLDE